MKTFKNVPSSWCLVPGGVTDKFLFLLGTRHQELGTLFSLMKRVYLEPSQISFQFSVERSSFGLYTLNRGRAPK